MSDSHSLTRTFCPNRQPTQKIDGGESTKDSDVLIEAYDEIIERGISEWCETLRFKKRLGTGGQGIVYLSERTGTDGFILPVALKVFSPRRYDTEEAYLDAMRRMAIVSTKIALIQHDNLLNVNNWSEQQGVRIMEMELIDGKDLSKILLPRTLRWIHDNCSSTRYANLRNVVIDNGAKNLRLKSGIAVTIINECLKGLGALHREGIVHSDVKPSNIMIKRTGTAKIIDMGSAYQLDSVPARRTCTPAYAAPEVLDNDEPTVLSDLASLGYVFLEILTGKSLFPKQSTHLQDKRAICTNIESILGFPLCENNVLVQFCKKLVSPDPKNRFKSADEAALSDVDGAPAILRQLVRMNLASEYQNDLRVFMEDLADMDDDSSEC